MSTLSSLSGSFVGVGVVARNNHALTHAHSAELVCAAQHTLRAMGGKRQYVVKGTTFEVDDRYEVKKGVGQGAYGLICAAKDTASEDQVCWP